MRFLMSFATNYQPATTSSRQSTTNNTLSLWSTWNPTEGHGRTFIEVVTVVWHYFTDTEVVCQQDCRRMWAIWGDNSSEWEVPLEIFSRKVNVKSFIICHCQNNDNKIVCLMVKLFMRYLLSNLLKRASLLPEKTSLALNEINSMYEHEIKFSLWDTNKLYSH